MPITVPVSVSTRHSWVGPDRSRPDKSTGRLYLSGPDPNPDISISGVVSKRATPILILALLLMLEVRNTAFTITTITNYMQLQLQLQTTKVVCILIGLIVIRMPTCTSLSKLLILLYKSSYQSFTENFVRGGLQSTPTFFL